MLALTIAKLTLALVRLALGVVLSGLAELALQEEALALLIDVFYIRIYGSFHVFKWDNFCKVKLFETYKLQKLI